MGIAARNAALVSLSRSGKKENFEIGRLLPGYEGSLEP